jgi:hypothetical protein
MESVLVLFKRKKEKDKAKRDKNPEEQLPNTNT